MSDDKPPRDTSRREAIKTALKASAYAAPIILSAVVPAPAAAQVSGATILTGTVTDSSNGRPIPGATLTVGGVTTATTNASGVYTINNAPSGFQSIVTSAPAYLSRTDSVNIIARRTTTFSPALDPDLS